MEIQKHRLVNEVLKKNLEFIKLTLLDNNVVIKNVVLLKE